MEKIQTLHLPAARMAGSLSNNPSVCIGTVTHLQVGQAERLTCRERQPTPTFNGWMAKEKKRIA